MDDSSIDVLMQLSVDELAEVLEEFTGAEFSDEQVGTFRQLIEVAGSLDGALGLLEELGPSAEAA
jgi:hypothetical protein